jgi:hypothetical protein
MEDGSELKSLQVKSLLKWDTLFFSVYILEKVEALNVIFNQKEVHTNYSTEFFLHHTLILLKHQME